MNTEKGSKNGDFLQIERTSVPTKLDDTAAELERQLQYEKDHRKEERFLWLFAVVLLMDIITFPLITWSSIFIALLELIFLMVAAKWLGVDWAVVLIERVFDKYINQRDDPEDG